MCMPMGDGTRICEGDGEGVGIATAYVCEQQKINAKEKMCFIKKKNCLKVTLDVLNLTSSNFISKKPQGNS